jgi:F-type H+-transporting ATPase subunit b
VHALFAAVNVLLAQEEVSEAKDLYPKLAELILGAIAFGILFFFMWKWVLPRLNQTLDARRDKIQGDLERAEQTRGEADQMLAEYRQQLANAREDANHIIEEARKTAESMRKDLVARAEQENQAILGRAQEEIRAERDRVFQELKSQVAELSLTLAARVVGEDLDRDRHLRLVDQYIAELSTMGSNGNGNGNGDGSRADGSES